MKCWECIARNWKSRIYIAADATYERSSTPGIVYWDEDGNYHSHTDLQAARPGSQEDLGSRDREAVLGK